MNNLFLGLVLAFSVLVVGCASSNDVNESSQSPETYVGIENGMLIYSGGITEISNNSIFALFNEAEVKPLLRCFICLGQNENIKFFLVSC